MTNRDERAPWLFAGEGGIQVKRSDTQLTLDATPSPHRPWPLAVILGGRAEKHALIDEPTLTERRPREAQSAIVSTSQTRVTRVQRETTDDD